MKKINSNLYKLAMSKFATGVTVVSINYNNNYIGKTVNSFSALSLDPPLVLFSLDKKSSSIQQYKNSKYFGINILAKNLKKLSAGCSNISVVLVDHIAAPIGRIKRLIKSSLYSPSERNSLRFI